MELNEKLLSLRKKNKLTQAQVAETLDVSRQAISNWETGAVLPSTDNLIALSRLYQLPVDHLLSGLNGDTDLTPAPAKEKEVDKKEATAPETEYSNTNSKIDSLKKTESNYSGLSIYHSFGRCSLCCSNAVRTVGKRTQGYRLV